MDILYGKKTKGEKGPVMSEGKIGIYMHGGSDNRGCEAIIRSTIRQLSKFDYTKIAVYTNDIEADCRVGLEKLCKLYKIGKTFVPYTFNHIYLKIKSILKRDINTIRWFRYQNLLKSIQKNDRWFSVGGDNYCGYGLEGDLVFLNHEINRRGGKTILWGCSIEPELLDDEKLRMDLDRYSLIVARESITEEALKNRGIRARIKLLPDPAFQLEKQAFILPEEFIEGGTIGINISPLIQNREKNVGIVYENYKNLINYILEQSSYSVALIPHVIKNNSDDRAPQKKLWENFRETRRVVLLNEEGELNCMQLKYAISKCRMMFTARTHASIAAYSSYVPTVVVGYSVKAKGIARDIFGTDEKYVLPVQSLAGKEDLIDAYRWLEQNRKQIYEHLLNFMPSYIERWEKEFSISDIL